ncbi:toll-like receptor Tollo [Varroa jacobsoni]|uniref:toll-like receptor Tollo n=1 Tax=Varroa jacobsoni TaxID=62625 RepID=UPI000BF8D81A|nr:toll-like receptor Tollo [Varroa jacobsoni]
MIETTSRFMNTRASSVMSVQDTFSIGCASIWTILWLAFLLAGCCEARYVRPEDCTWEPVADAAGVSIACSVRTLQAGINPTNFSLIMPAHTVQLAVICGDQILQSELANSLFVHLYGLRELSIEHCNLAHLPSKTFEGLLDLKRLSVKTFNIKRGRFSLQVSPTAFSPLKAIEMIDLSENSIDLLPHTLFCGLEHLRFVNLSGNAFHDSANLGLSSKSRCRPNFRGLDVTRSKLKVLSTRGLETLVSLEELRMERNQIARIDSDAFSGLAKLTRLDLSHNSFSTLPSRLFQSTSKLAELYMRNNSLNALPSGLLAGLRELTLLDLAHNQLSALGWLQSAQDLAQLAVLDLSYNRLTRLNANVFTALSELQTLQLQNNLIELIADGTFIQLNNLQSLVLSHNRLKRIGSRMIGGLNSVTTLHLDDNRISEVSDDTFANMTMLQELNLARNELIATPLIVSSLNMLRTLDLSDNKINDVVNFSSQGLGQLYALNLMGNRIGNLSRGVFSRLPSVRILNLANNRIQTIEQETFDDMPGLHYLRLDSNVIEDVNGLFSNLHDLIMLNISVNRIRWFDYALVPVGLQWLDIHDNQIEALGNYFDLEQSLKLRTLDASYNKLTDLDSSSLPNGIEIVFLKNNNIKLIQPFTFLGKHNLTRVDLTSNQLKVLEKPTFRLSEVSTRRPLPEFAIAGNPYVCDCNMEWLQRLHNPTAQTSSDTNSLRQYPRVIDLHSVECELTFSKSFQKMPLVKVDSSQFLCPYKSHCFPLCHCCDFDACDCEMVCPANCSCYQHQTWRTNIVDCSSRSHLYNPRQLPMEVTELYLDGNNIPEISKHSFVGRKNMRVLFLNSSNIVTVQNRSFAGLHELRALHLEDNRISELHGHEFDDLDRLRELYLSNNQLKHLSNITFTRLKNLEILHLDRNYLVEISVWSFQYNTRLTEIRLARNPWTCDCQFRMDFSQFLFNERGNIARDLFDLLCVYNETKALPLWELNVTECFSPSEATSLVRSFHIHRVEDLVPALVVLGAVILLSMAVTAGIVYRRKLSVWFFSRYGVRMCHRNPIEEEKLFDAFVSYSKKDDAFVAQILAPALECGSPPYRLCLHYRDLSMAGGYLSEAIQEAVESSRRTIVVLSEHFLKSEWCRYEFKTAHYEVLYNSNHKLVVIFLGRVSYRELDADIKMWLKRSTFLHWGEKNFWDKLRYSLPDARHRKVQRSDLNSVTVHI